MQRLYLQKTMRKKIKLIPKDIVSKIAAGEIIERPSSIIKELVENSIDAGAKSIEVVIENGGKDLILVKDDGCGIPSDQLSLAFTRHASSKLRNMNDFDTMSTLGFRGEALASIACIANVNIKTAANSRDGAEINVKGAELSKIKNN